MNRFTKLVIGSTFALSAMASLVAIHRTMAQEITIQPFTATQVSELIEGPADGTTPPLIPHYHYKQIAVRSDGSVASVIRWRYSVADLYTRDVFDAATKHAFTSDDVTKSLVEGDFHEETDVMHLGTCPGTAAGQMQGFDVVYQERLERLPNLAPDVTAVTKEWNAPKLGCYAIKSELIHKHGNAIKSDAIVELSNIHLGDPDPRYFEVPTKYASRTPEVWRSMIGAAIVKGRQANSPQ